MKRTFAVLCLISAALCIQGCGQKMGGVKGTVSIGDKTLAMGTVTFISSGEDKKPYQTAIKEDGTFSISGVPVGEVKVVVVSTDPAKKPKSDRTKDTKGADDEGRGGGKGDAKWIEVPKIYGDLKTTPLVFTIKDGSEEVNNLEIKLRGE